MREKFMEQKIQLPYITRVCLDIGNECVGEFSRIVLRLITQLKVMKTEIFALMRLDAI